MLFLLPLFDDSNYIQYPDYDELLIMMQSIHDQYGGNDTIYSDVVDYFVKYNDANTDIH